MPRRRRKYNTAGRRILAVLRIGGPRKFNVLAGILKNRERTSDALRRLKAAGLIFVVHRYGGPHYAATDAPKGGVS